MSTVFVNLPTNGQAIPMSFLESLRDSRLLSEDQLTELLRWVNDLDMPTLTAVLLEEEWLTSYQLGRVLEGRGRGLTLGQYRLLEELGEGGFGKVYKAVHGLMNRVAAVKVIAPKWTQNARGRDLFLREVTAVTRLAHPNIVMAYDANQTDDLLWFAMEYVDGSNLEQFVDERGPLPVPFACAVMLQVARALQFAHEHGMVHRDVKPANLLLPRAAEETPPAGVASESPPVFVKVVDFGLAKLVPVGTNQAPTICEEGFCVGTPEYMSPEQALNSYQVDIRSDLYSLGCTFYFALAGRPPFCGATNVETITHHLESEPEPLGNVRPDIPVEVVETVRRLMAKKPEDRYLTPSDLIEALTNALTNLCRQRLSWPVLSAVRSPSAKEGDPAPEPAVSGPAPEHGLSRPQSQEPAFLAADVGRPLETAAVKEPAYALWREWLAVVEALARGMTPEWSEKEYALLYRALMDGAHDHAASPSHPQSAAYARVEALVEPWLKLRALRDLDTKTMAGLLQTCRQTDAELCPPPWVPFGVWVVMGLMFIGSALLAATLFHAGW